MKTNLNDDEWKKTYPIFGHLYGNVALASYKRHLAVFGSDLKLKHLLHSTAKINFEKFYALANIDKLLKEGVTTDQLMMIEQNPVSALSVSQITKMSRELTRKKLIELTAMGWLEYGCISDKTGFITTRKTLEFFYNETRLIYEDFARMCNMLHELEDNLKIKSEKS